jgi:hypothetical protein
MVFWSMILEVKAQAEGHALTFQAYGTSHRQCQMLSPLNLVFAEVASRYGLDRLCFVVPDSAGPKEIVDALNQKKPLAAN